MRTALTLLPALVIIGTPTASTAQFTFLLDGGQRTEKYGTGFARTMPYGGIGMGAALTGDAGERAGFLVSAAGELKAGTGGAFDGKITGDAMLRLGPIAFGAGLDLLAPMVGDVRDQTSPDGKRGIDDEQLFGYSGIAKVNFGPLNKAFVQARITTYPQGSGFRLINGCDSEYLSSDLAQSCNQVIADHDPEFRSGDEARVSLGYVFSGSGSAKILRLQWLQQRLTYVHEKDNIGGAYDRNVQALTLGLVLSF